MKQGLSMSISQDIGGKGASLASLPSHTIKYTSVE